MSWGTMSEEDRVAEKRFSKCCGAILVGGGRECSNCQLDSEGD